MGNVLRNFAVACAVTLICSNVGHAQSYAEFVENWRIPTDWPMPERWLPVDDQGWTIVEPAADSRLIYVSASEGNDDNGAVYAIKDAAVGERPLSPDGPIHPFKTLEKALENARDGKPDWILLKRGDVWRDTTVDMRSGRSASEPFVVRAYGEGERPVFKGRRGGVRFGNSKQGVQHAVLMDLVLYCSFLDPKSPDYGVDKAEELSRTMASMGIGIHGGSREPAAENNLVENCMIRFSGFSCTGDPGLPMMNCVFRRDVVLDKYPPTGHTMGMWGSSASVLLEECIFDHNGWLVQGGRGTEGEIGRAIALSHNTYCGNMYNTLFRGNIFTRPASMGNKFTANNRPASSCRIMVENNLYVDGDIGISMGGNKAGPLRWKDCRVTDNVMLDIGLTRPTNRPLAWYLDVYDWDGGLVAGNLLLHQCSQKQTGTYAIMIASIEAKHTGKHAGPAGHIRNVTVRDNVIHGLFSGGAVLNVANAEGGRIENIRIADNQIQMPGLETRLVAMMGKGLSEVRLSGNTYYSDADKDACFRVNKAEMDFKQWKERAGEPDAQVDRIEYPDDTRSIQSYMKHLGLDPTHEAFYAEIRKQCRANWRPEFTAPVINDWMRAGFGMKPVEQEP